MRLFMTTRSTLPAALAARSMPSRTRTAKGKSSAMLAKPIFTRPEEVAVAGEDEVALLSQASGAKRRAAKRAAMIACAGGVLMVTGASLNGAAGASRIAVATKLSLAGLRKELHRR